MIRPRRHTLLLSLLLPAVLAACNQVSPTEPTDGDFDPAKVGYFRDSRTDLCFAVATYSRWSTDGHVASGLSHSVVPCSQQVLALVHH